MCVRSSHVCFCVAASHSQTPSGGLRGELEAFVEDAEMLLGETVRGDVGLDRDPVDELSGGVVHRLHVDDLPIGMPALGVVEDFNVAAFAALDGFSKLGDARGIGVGPLQEMSGLLALHLGERIAGHALERGVGPLEAALGVGDDDAVGGVAGDEAELGVFARGRAQVHAEGAQLVGAARDELLEAGGLVFEHGVEPRVLALGGLAAIVDFDGGSRREPGVQESADHQQREHEGRRVAWLDESQVQQHEREREHAGGQQRDSIKQPSGEGARGRFREQHAHQLVVRSQQQSAGAQDKQRRGLDRVHLERLGVARGELQRLHEQRRGTQRKGDDQKPRRHMARQRARLLGRKQQAETGERDDEHGVERHVALRRGAVGGPEHEIERHQASGGGIEANGGDDAGDGARRANHAGDRAARPGARPQRGAQQCDPERCFEPVGVGLAQEDDRGPHDTQGEHHDAGDTGSAANIGFERHAGGNGGRACGSPGQKQWRRGAG